MTANSVLGSPFRARTETWRKPQQRRLWDSEQPMRLAANP